MSRIYFPVFGSGLGHITRIYSLAENLREPGIEYLYSSFDEGLDFLIARGERVRRCPSIDLKWNDSGGFSSRGSFIRFPRSVFTFSKQVGNEIENISNFDPNLVVSDSRLSAVFAARIKSCPVITILNQFKILFPPRFRTYVGTQLFERTAGNMLGLFWSLSDEVLMPDLPLPYTISEANVVGCDVAKRVKFVGFMSTEASVSIDRIQQIKSTLGLGSRPVLFIQISGPKATKKSLTDVVLQSTAQLSKKCNVVISMGQPDGSTEPKKLANDAWIFEWCPIKEELFALSDIVVARAGHTTISQCIEMGKPAVYVPIFNHSEQIWNADKCQRLGIGLQLRSEYLCSTNLINSVEKCLNDPKIKDNVERIRSVSKRYRGIETTAQIIRSYL